MMESDTDEANIDVEESDSASRPKKRRRTKVGRVPLGEDFWGKVDTYFSGMVKQYGRDLAGQRWKE